MLLLRFKNQAKPRAFSKINDGLHSTFDRSASPLNLLSLAPEQRRPAFSTRFAPTSGAAH
jgi:hypothetical protein